MRAAFFAVVALVRGLVVSGASCYAAGAFTQTDWPHCFQVTPNILAYSAKSTDSQYLRLGMYNEGFTGGWSSLAFSSNGGMKGARQIVVRKRSGEWVAEDRYSQSASMPVMSSFQDVKLISAMEGNNAIAWAVLLDLNDCKPDMAGYPTNFDLSQDMERFMLWAQGSSHIFGYHDTNRGSFHANVISGPASKPSIASMESFDVLMPNVDVVVGPEDSDAKNPYVCGILDLNALMPGKNLSQKHHIAAFRPKIDSVSAKYVHHILMFGCSGDSFSHQQVIKNCVGMPSGCNDFKYAWALGSEDLIFPENVGFPLGGNERFVALQMHYYNPNLDAGIKDSSGVEIVLAPNLRQEDAGLLQINGGAHDSQRLALPSGQAQTTVSFQMPTECTNSWTHSEVDLLGVLYHAHTLGTHLDMDLTRDGHYVGQMYAENMFDFNHQSVHPSNIRKLRKGDEITVTCTYDTSSRNAPVSFGENTDTEMCWFGMYYYPRQPLSGAHYMGKYFHQLASNTDFAAQGTLLQSTCGTTGTAAGFTSMSACAQDYYMEPFFSLGAHQTKGQHPGYTMYVVCTYGIPTGDGKPPTSPQQINQMLAQQGKPTICPESCFSQASCTEDDVKQYIQSQTCVAECGRYKLSVYPDTSATTPVVPIAAASCEKQHGTETKHEFITYTPINYSVPACQVVGDLSSPSAMAAMQECSTCPTWVNMGTTIEGTISMTVEDISQLSDSLAIEGFKNAIATLAGASNNSVSVTIRTGTRRLRSSGERLLAVVAYIDYVIIVLGNRAVLESRLTNTSTIVVQSAIVKAMSEKGITQTMTVSVMSVGVATSTTMVSLTTTMAESEQADISGAVSVLGRFFLYGIMPLSIYATF